LAAAYLSAPIHIYTISVDGTVKTLEKAELDRLADTCETWRELERESVGTLLSPTKEPEEEAEIPEPEQ